MILVTLAELVVVALLLYLGVTEVVLPLWRNTPLFPMFRREGRLQHELAEATESVVEAELEKKIAETAQRAESVRRTVSRPVKPTSGSGKPVNR
ncbi:MAG: hypothetical protein A2655_01680 [Candidatus Yanofskybacteria bacterium RIFCSPHIGHO2_01_FULL_43_42]|uniref:Uncharacterized protein n=1 Tax=Candidatus Yanofskybacteria bacterium RIFCSPLOWO2_01_FULL_43_22 TaxID=1802695 RepID=A0A1F8GH17_9BACT|nr:MAG: hypothetical protein A2655_01680 [Candidatus Yanofskybacteria bacterium RIFCSPHIGHO2_01_FULL_43_42]OGN13188.1 MAG: hypothetical protein A3D48_02585 [Candidatus Yanofskybacteria bacterium RIFCSPHIGHO2_02_FULL_43_17]OGN24603.1 MAG: hypothetical protein A3A13_00810 [Candidatus Yanofskybacteria bacterium RIFCSPLOWO2_01_FULL_43_22]